MTNVIVEHMGDRYVISAAGHANYAENGKDIVCAALSALVQSFQFLCEEEQENKKCIIVSLVDEEGRYLLVVDGLGNILDSAFKMLRIGIESLSMTYPKNISMLREKTE